MQSFQWDLFIVRKRASPCTDPGVSPCTSIPPRTREQLTSAPPLPLVLLMESAHGRTVNSDVQEAETASSTLTFDLNSNTRTLTHPQAVARQRGRWIFGRPGTPLFTVVAVPSSPPCQTFKTHSLARTGVGPTPILISH